VLDRPPWRKRESVLSLVISLARPHRDGCLGDQPGGVF
jgi:hypothetical protein